MCKPACGEKRKAWVMLNSLMAKSIGMDPGQHLGTVQGPFQYGDEVGSYPVYVAEFPEGQVITVCTECIQFEVRP